jgi:hypothetical protein
MSNPKRIIDPESRSSLKLRALLRAGRSDLPSGHRIESIGVRLGPRLGGADAGRSSFRGSRSGAAGAGGAAVGDKLATAAKLCALTLVALGVAAGTYVETRQAPAEGAPVLVTVPAVQVASASIRGPAASLAGSTIDRATPATAAVPAVPSPAPMPSPGPAPALASEPAAPARAAATAPVSMPARAPEPAPALATDAEVSLLQSAQDALPSDPRAALLLVGRHAARFPHGALAQEREVLAIEALLRLDRHDDARLRAGRFYRDFPRSAHRARIEALVGETSSHNP